jgi:hypothetical protein
MRTEVFGITPRNDQNMPAPARGRQIFDSLAPLVAVVLHPFDDGCGSDQTVAHDGFGLIGMKERAQAIGGELSIQSTTMGGTTISIVLSIPRDGQPGEPR